MDSLSSVFLSLIVFLSAPFQTCAIPSNAKDWRQLAESDLVRVTGMKKNENMAKNIILFMGDAMSLGTVAAGRILKGQIKGKAIEPLVFERFPNVALSQTYSTDRQVSDSASTGTAYLCGVKTNFGVLGFDSTTENSVCASEEQQRRSRVDSILKMAHDAGKLTGVVTNTRITHASPAASYAHSADREWESDNHMVNVTGNCVDIARQLVDENDYIRVLMGGGRRSFIPVDMKDPETGKEDVENGRLDKRDLIADWLKDKESKKVEHSYVWNKEQFNKVNPKHTDYLLGLFSPSHMSYDLDRDQGPTGEPSLAEMTKKAIQILQKGPKGFFLFVEGGLIDSAHHDNQAKKALYDTLAFDKAIETATKLVDIKDTLLIVTADHSTAFELVGYPTTYNPIFAAVDNTEWGGSSDGLPYTSLLYATGPGFKVFANGKRENISKVDTESNDYLQQSAVPMEYGTHSGEDVAVYAIGPWSHLYQGVHEQNYIPHVMAYAACISQLGKTSAHCAGLTNSSGFISITYTWYYLALIWAYIGIALRQFV